jgi:ATP-dependent protease ClpP protease subunit
MSIRYESTLTLYGDIGADCDVNAMAVRDALNEIGPGPIDVNLNSPGGSAIEGQAIYNALVAHPGQVTIYVDGVAASAGSLIAMAGDIIVMREGAMMMVHDPSTIGMGTARDLRTQADNLDKLSEQYRNIYAKRTGLDTGAVAKMMTAETWLDADEAVKLGFATRKSTDAAMAAPSFNYSLYRNTPTMLTKGAPMPTTTVQATTTTTPEIEPQKPWVGKFMQHAEASGIALAQLNAIVEASPSHGAAKNALIEAMAKEQNAGKPGFGAGFQSRQDETFDNPAFFAKAASDAIYFRMKGAAPEGPSQHLASHSLIEIGVMGAQLSGRRISRLGGRHAVVDAIMSMAGGETTSDLPNIFGTSVNRYLLEAYQVAQSPMKQLARTRDALDFRAINVIRLSEAPGLLPVIEGAEVTYGAHSDKKETYAVQTFARAFALTRQAIVNDDLSAFADTGRAWGIAAALCEANTIAAAFLANAGAGTNLSDGNPLYTTGRGNKAASGAALSVDTLSTGRAVLRNAKGLDGTTPLNLVPKYLVTGAALETSAGQITRQITPTTVSAVNPFADALTPLVEPRFGDNSWRLFADPAQLPTFEIAYLNGAQAPIVKQKDGWDVLGMEFMAIFDFGVGLTEWRSTYLNPGE